VDILTLPSLCAAAASGLAAELSASAIAAANPPRINIRITNKQWPLATFPIMPVTIEEHLLSQ
jgi:hypothetical protein